MEVKSGIKAKRQETSSIPLFMWLLKGNSSHSITHYYPIRRPSQTHCCAAALLCTGPCVQLKTTFIQRIRRVTFEGSEGRKTHPNLAGTATTTAGVKSTGPLSLHSCLGRHGDSKGHGV